MQSPVRPQSPVPAMPLQRRPQLPAFEARLLVLFGPPGAGRSACSAELSRRLGLAWVPVRDLMQAAALEPGGSAHMLRLHLQAGSPVPAKLALSVLTGHLEKVDWSRGAVLDGFPQTLEQAQALDHWLALRGQAPSQALRLELSREEVLRRLSGRRFCHQCPHAAYNLFHAPPRQDGLCDECQAPLYQRLRDREDIVLRRLRRRNVEELPLELYYREAGLLERVDASGSVDALLERIAERWPA